MSFEMLTLPLAHITVASIAAVACVIDLKERRIPNWLTFGAAASGLAYHLLVNGLSGLGFAAAGWLVGVAIFFLPFVLRGLGGGDIKLLGALGAWLGPMDIAWLSLYTGVAGGVLALVVSVARGYLGQAIRNIWLLLMHLRTEGVRPLPELTIHHGTGPRLAYGAAIFAGAMVTVWTR
jgi:prepilin peptidase CpaA